MRKEDLVYLVYTRNLCYVKVVDKAPAEVSTDVCLGRYAFYRRDLSGRQLIQMEIGNGSIPQHPSEDGLIGVYDRTNTEHLSAMTFNAQEAVRRSIRNIVDAD